MLHQLILDTILAIIMLLNATEVIIVLMELKTSVQQELGHLMDIQTVIIVLQIISVIKILLLEVMGNTRIILLIQLVQIVKLDISERKTG